MRTFIENPIEIMEMVYRRLHHLPPLGYVSDIMHWKFLLDSARAPLIRETWKLAAAGTPIDDLLRFLNDDRQFRTPPRGRLGGKPLRRSALYKLLTDPFYAGYIRDDDRLARGYHEPLVSEDDFFAVQHLLEQRRRNRGSRLPPAAT